MTGDRDAAFGQDPYLPDTPGFEWAAAQRDLIGWDSTTPCMPRVWHFLAGGKDHYPADECFGECVEALHPQVVDIARHRIAFRSRAVRTLVEDFGIGQLLVAGTDVPLHDEVHEVAHRIDPSVGVLYADLDPWVMAHARALLNSTGTCDHVQAGLEDPAVLLAETARILDLDKSVGVLLINSLDGLDDDAAAHALAVLRAGLSSGSGIVISHLSGAIGRTLAAFNKLEITSVRGLPHARNPADVRALFAGLEVVEPGVVLASQWRPEPALWKTEPVDLWCGIGRVRGPRPERGLR